MSREEIIKLAREAGFTEGDLAVFPDLIVHFASLVAAAEREACAKVCKNEEAQLLYQEGQLLPRGEPMLLKMASVANYCATAIRARGTSMSIEAMKMALEALEFNDYMRGSRPHASKAITALRRAIEQAEQTHAIDTSQERVDEIVKQEHDKQIEIAQAYERGWNAALAQQEPVAWISEGGDVSRSKRYMDEMGFKCNPLYTAPPPRKPLTDEEIETIANDFEEGYVFLYRSFARAIEAAHGIGDAA